MYKTNFTICSKEDVVPIGTRGGVTGLRYPWFDRSIPVGKGFFIERTQQELDADKGRPSIPTARLSQHGMSYKTYKSRRGNAVGYMCERTS